MKVSTINLIVSRKSSHEQTIPVAGIFFDGCVCEIFETTSTAQPFEVSVGNINSCQRCLSMLTQFRSERGKAKMVLGFDLRD